MIKHLIVAASLTASCAFPVAGHAQTHAEPTHAVVATTVRPLDPAKRAWLGQAVSHILGEDAERSGAR